MFLPPEITSVSTAWLLPILKNPRQTPDLISMPTHSDADGDRRRSPRFNCGGLAKINCLPSDGVSIPARLRDLSLHGCAVDTALPIDYGVRTEIVVCANASSFRALGEVRVIRGGAGAGFEFIQLSCGGKKLLQDLLTDLARLQAITNGLRLDRQETEADFRRRLEEGRRIASMVGSRSQLELITPAITHTTTASERQETGPQETTKREPEGRPEEGPRLVIAVDLFG
jgi:hypothetical protein